MFKGYMKVYNTAGLTAAIAALIFSILYNQTKHHSYVLKIALCQTFFIFEIINIKMGTSRSTILPTTIQLFSRLFLIWPICFLHQNVTKSNYFTIMTFSWFLADSVRYIFYLFRTKMAKWLRYNLFIVLYPVGITMEMILTYTVLSIYGTFMRYIATGLIVLWSLAFIFLYYHMIKQRRYANKRRLVKKKKNV